MEKWAFVLSLFVMTSMSAQSLTIIYGNRLYYHKADKFVEIKRLEDCSSFQGYDIVDSSHIFIAYNPEISAEASVYIVIFDLDTGKESLIEELGGTGESFFQYNPENDLVAFNWGNGINVFKLHASNNKFIEKIEPILLVECDCYLPYWIDRNTIGYQVWENDKWRVKTVKVNK